MNEATIIKKLLIDGAQHAIIMLKIESEHLPALDIFLQGLEKPVPKEKSNVLSISVAENVSGRSKFG
jgi:hypothetical protein